jgi:hypothetical protein
MFLFTEWEVKIHQEIIMVELISTELQNKRLLLSGQVHSSVKASRNYLTSAFKGFFVWPLQQKRTERGMVSFELWRRHRNVTFYHFEKGFAEENSECHTEFTQM